MRRMSVHFGVSAQLFVQESHRTGKFRSSMASTATFQAEIALIFSGSGHTSLFQTIHPTSDILLAVDINFFTLAYNFARALVFWTYIQVTFTSIVSIIAEFWAIESSFYVVAKFSHRFKRYVTHQLHMAGSLLSLFVVTSHSRTIILRVISTVYEMSCSRIRVCVSRQTRPYETNLTPMYDKIVLIDVIYIGVEASTNAALSI